jgi:hypothetical protein
MTLYSFRKFNPDWEMILYYTDNLDMDKKTWKSHNVQDFHNYNGDNYIDKIKDLNIKIEKWDLKYNNIISKDIKMGPSHKSNFLKWSKLHEIGGIYSDLDILYFKPIDSFYNFLINGNYDTSICQTSHLSIGLLASKEGGNDFFKDIFINGINKFNIGEYQSAGVLNIYNLYKGVPHNKILDNAKIKYKDLNFYNIPMDLVYYLGSMQVSYAIKNSFGVKDFHPVSIGYHWYAGHPDIQKYNNLLNENTYNDYDITFTKLVKEII